MNIRTAPVCPRWALLTAALAAACAEGPMEDAPIDADGGVAAAEHLYWTATGEEPFASMPEDEGPAVAQREDELICGRENWQNLLDFQFDPAYRVGVNYGTAVAKLSGDDHRCTGFLYDGRYLLTAEHCHKGEDLTARFGRFPGGEAYGRARLQDLGLWSFSAASVPREDFMDFNCRFRRDFDRDAYDDRDIAVFRCDPKTIAGLGAIWPGDIWGQMQLDPGRRGEGTDVYVISDNEPSWGNGTRLLLSPGGDITDDYDWDCYPFSGHGQCFEHDADTLGGSSGGPILLRESHRVLGLVMGNFGLNNDCPVGSTNYGTYVVDEDDLDRDRPWFSALPADADLAWSRWVGGTGGGAHWLQCPDRHLAIGVIGTTYPYDPAGNARVGNLGLVCAPYHEHPSQAARTTAFWKVIVGGSIDTGFASGLHDFNAYVNEVLDLQADDGSLADFLDQQQGVTVCRPGFYLSGLRLQAGRYVDRVDGIECVRHDGRAFHSKSPRKPLGTRASNAVTLRCPDRSGDPDHALPDRAVDGIYIRSGWLTDGFRLRCRAYTEPRVASTSGRG